MSEYTLELFTVDGKYIIKDDKGIAIGEPLSKEDALQELAALVNPKEKVEKKPKQKKQKKKKEIKNDGEEE